MSPIPVLLGRFDSTVRQFLKFGLVGGAGVLVNMAVYMVANQVAIHAFGSHEYDAFLPLPGTERAIRNYIVYAVLAFLVANLFNFVWNRRWTFKDHHGEAAPFWKEFLPFLLVGSVAQVLGLVILQLLMNRNSPLYLSADYFTDGSPFWSRRAYWAQLIQIVCVMPINFLVNKLWTFRAVRQRHSAATAADRARHP